jgi:IMP dehydrogenase
LPGQLQFDPERNAMAKFYRGMGSMGAMIDSDAARDRYGVESDLDVEELVPEGVEGTVPYKGPLRKELIQLTGGIRKCMGYLGVPDIAGLHQYAEFWEQSQAGMAEAHPSVKIVRPAPNYSR